MNRSKRKIILFVVLAAVLSFTLVMNGTLAWFTSQIMSSVSSIITGNLDVQVNGKKQEFLLNIRTEPVFPNDYIVPIGSSSTSVEVRVKNTGSIDIFYTGGYIFQEDDIVGYGLVFEEVRRVLYNSSNEKVKDEYFIKNHRVVDKHEAVKTAIDVYTVNGVRDRAGDDYISLNEWRRFQNDMCSINKGYYVGALKPQAYEKWIYKIKLHKDCTADVMADKTLSLRYRVLATQFETDAVKNLIRNNDIILVPDQMSEEDFNFIADGWVNTEGRNLLNLQ